MKTHFCKFLFLLFCLVQNSLSSQEVNSAVLIDVNKIESSNSVSNNTEETKKTIKPPLQPLVTDSTSVYGILPKQYDSTTMDSKPE